MKMQIVEKEESRETLLVKGGRVSHAAMPAMVRCQWSSPRLGQLSRDLNWAMRCLLETGLQAELGVLCSPVM